MFPFSWYRYDDPSNDFLSTNDSTLAFARPLTHDGVRSVVIWGKEKTQRDIADVEHYFVEHAELFGGSSLVFSRAGVAVAGPVRAEGREATHTGLAKGRAADGASAPPAHFEDTGTIPPYTACSL